MLKPLKRGIKIPKKSIKLAEETGIHIGDGNLNYHRSVGKNHWSYTHSSHAKEKDYQNFIKNLMFDLYQIQPYERRYGNCVDLIFTRKNLVLFKKSLDLPVGNKRNIKIPKWIMENEKFKIACLRGIFDTDGGLRFRKPYKSKKYTYPEIKLISCSLNLIEDVKQILNEIEITYYYGVRKIDLEKNIPNLGYIIVINGKKRLEKFMTKVGFSNKKHLDKYNFWKKNGYCLPDYLKKKKKSGDGGI
ncbi:hypothetical protein HN385_03290 [archaeon]|jgi:hypothetical protein|nr:hypothetical protein [archaeon]MBT3451425.1 hypothetical protein [archaeon]MBT6869721.1 hypothetical protein [archaeon]MBT7192676.1 hypothetical protein [archaeon]MBT7380701.1 hypothetical protein [archaeon]